MLMRLSDFTFLNTENDSSMSHEVTGAYLSEEIWGKVNLYKILLQFPNILLLLFFLSTFWPQSCNEGEWGLKNSSVTKKAGTVESPMLYFLSLSLSFT